MIISKTPLRITLGGGGSDLTPDGICITAAINLHVYVAVNHNHTQDYLLRYSDTERVPELAAIKHSLMRDCLTYADTSPGVEITSIADVGHSSGLGSSGAFTVGLLRALLPHEQTHRIVKAACQLDIGLQDQHAAGYGGLTCWDFAKDAHESIESPSWLSHLYLYDTGLRRNAREALQANPRPPINVLRAQAATMREILLNGTPEAFGEALTDQWRSKLRAAPTETHLDIDRRINTLLTQGALGAKLVGAGDGGMILAMSEEGRKGAIPVKLDPLGTRLLA